MPNVPAATIAAFTPSELSVSNYNHLDTTGDENKTFFEEFKSTGETLKTALNAISGEEAITVDDTTQEITQDYYNTKMTTAHASSVASIGDGHTVGQRKLITLETLGTAGDEVALDPDNIHNASGTQATGVTFDAADEFLLLEWTGAEWQEIYGTATIGTA